MGGISKPASPVGNRQVSKGNYSRKGRERTLKEEMILFCKDHSEAGGRGTAVKTRPPKKRRLRGRGVFSK